MRSMVEGCPPLESGTPLRQSFGLPPPIAGEELQFNLSDQRLTLRFGRLPQARHRTASAKQRVHDLPRVALRPQPGQLCPAWIG